MTTKSTKMRVAILAVAGIAATALYAQPREEMPGPGYGRGGAMMYGWNDGRGPREDWGRGYGAGMMGGRGFGMMGPGMMGPRMMGGGFGMGGMAGGYALATLDLTEAQRKHVLAVRDEIRKKNWTLMGAMHDETAKLRDALWAGDKRDRAAILAAHKRMSDLRQQMLENRLDAADQIEKALTPQQREMLKKRWGPGWLLDSDDDE